MDTASAQAVREGDAIARAYVEPEALTGPSHTLSSSNIDTMVQRIRVAQSALSSTSSASALDAESFANTASGAPLSVLALNPIYRNYRVSQGQNGALVVSVTSTQVQTPTGVMTIPSSRVIVPSVEFSVPSTQINVPGTQINVPSTQVNVPSTLVNVPSTQLNVPSTQVRTPSSVMNSLDLQPALCGR